MGNKIISKLLTEEGRKNFDSIDWVEGRVEMVGGRVEVEGKEKEEKDDK